MQRMLLEKKYPELREFCKAQLGIAPDDVDALFHYASALEALGEHENAERAFSKLFRLTHDRLFLICRSIPEFREGKREEAIASLKKAEKEEEDADKLLFLFEVALKNGETDIAGDAFHKAFRKDYKKALAHLQELFEKSGALNIQKRVLLASILMMLKEFGEETQKEAETP